jgi:predicted permease
MSLFRIRRTLQAIARAVDPSDEVDAEIQHHLQEVADRLAEQGMTPQDARSEAERRFGSVRGHKEKLVWMNRRGMAMRRGVEIGRRATGELRQATRGLLRNPGFSLGVLATLALGIGANGAMFAVTDRILLRAPDHIVRPDEVRRVLTLRAGIDGNPSYGSSLTYPDLDDVRGVGGFVGAGGYSGPRQRTMGSGDQASRVETAGASHDFFPLLGVEAALGRFPSPEEDQVEASPTAVLDWDFWQADFGGTPDALGRIIKIDGVDFTVIGVAPRGFTGVDRSRVDVWVPLTAYGMLQWGDYDFHDSRGFSWMRVVARVEDDARLAAAEAEATGVHRAGREEEISEGWYDANARVVTAPLMAARGPLASDESRVALWLSGVALLVLLIACANVANLLLARGEQRRREEAVRLSLGISRGALLRGAILEAVLLAAAGGVLALGMAHWGAVGIRDTLMPEIHWAGSAVDARLGAFMAAVALLAGLAAGIGPAIRSARADVAAQLQSGGRGSAGRRSRLRSGLAVAQVTFSVVLLVGAGLFVRSLAEVRSLDLGMDVDRLAVAQLEVEGAMPVFGEEPDQWRLENTALYEEAARVARGVPGVQSVSLTMAPFGWSFSGGIRVPGFDSIPRLPGGGPYYIVTDEHYLPTLGIEVVRGRGLEAQDRAGASRVAVVSETMARTLWPDEGALGQCFYQGEGEDTPCTTVVGVAEDVTRGSLEEAPHMAYYVPLTEDSPSPRGMYIRASGDAAAVASALAGPLRSFSPRVRYAGVGTLREALDPQARAWSLGATLFTLFGVLALLVAGVGLYSLLAFDVADRTRELGIRSALGASKQGLLRGVVLRGVGLATLGVVLGTLVAVAAAPKVENLLFGVGARDPLVLGGVAMVLLAAGALASWIPGLRATGIDPMEALRAE